MTLLATHCASQIDGRIAAANPATDRAIFSAIDHATPAYTRNAMAWFADVDLTCYAVWNSRYGGYFCPTAISPLHVVTAKHIALQIGDTVRFVATDGSTVVTRTIASVSTPFEDVQLCKLNVTLAGANVNYARVLPAAWANYLPISSALYAAGDGVPTVSVKNTNKKVSVGEAIYAGTSDLVLTVPKDDATRISFYEASIGGDSSSPSFLFIDGEAILLFCAWHAGPNGPFLSLLIDEINAALAALGGGFSLDEIDLSSYTAIEPPESEEPDVGVLTLVTKYAKTSPDLKWSTTTWTLTKDGDDTTTAPTTGETADLNGFGDQNNDFTVDENIACGLIIDSTSFNLVKLIVNNGVTINANYGDYSAYPNDRYYHLRLANAATAVLTGYLDGNAPGTSVVSYAGSTGSIEIRGGINGRVTTSPTNNVLFVWSGNVTQPAGWTCTLVFGSSGTAKFTLGGLTLSNAGTVTLTTSYPSKIDLTTGGGLSVTNSGDGVCTITLTSTGTFTPPASLSGVNLVLNHTGTTVTLAATTRVKTLTLTAGTLALGGFHIVYDTLSAVAVVPTGTGGIVAASFMAADNTIFRVGD